MSKIYFTDERIDELYSALISDVEKGGLTADILTSRLVEMVHGLLKRLIRKAGDEVAPGGILTEAYAQRLLQDFTNFLYETVTGQGAPDSRWQSD